jgi:hypothetical protein
LTLPTKTQPETVSQPLFLGEEFLAFPFNSPPNRNHFNINKRQKKLFFGPAVKTIDTPEPQYSQAFAKMKGEPFTGYVIPKTMRESFDRPICWPKASRQMDRRYSPISDLYGPAPEEKPQKRSSNSWLYVLLALVGFFVFESLVPVMRLRSAPPAAFTGAQAGAVQSKPLMTRACWEFGVKFVQNAYPYGRRLPDSLPPGLKGRTEKDTDFRSRCWPRLRDAWTQPGSWVEKYKWDTSWVTDPNDWFQQTLHKALTILGINN